MTKKTLSLKVKRNKGSKQVAEVAKEGSHDDPQKRFLNGVAINPSQWIRLELGSQQLTTRAMDLGAAYPEIKLYALLIDERPEEVTDFRRSVPAEVHASSSDASYDQHVRVANELLNTARKEAGEGHKCNDCH